MGENERNFYNICKDACEKAGSAGGKIGYFEFWKYLESLKIKYSLGGKRLLNPVWWALMDTGYMSCNIIGGSESVIELKRNYDNEFEGLAKEYFKDFAARISKA